MAQARISSSDERPTLPHDQLDVNPTHASGRYRAWQGQHVGGTLAGKFDERNKRHHMRTRGDTRDASRDITRCPTVDERVLDTLSARRLTLDHHRSEIAHGTQRSTLSARRLALDA